MKNSESTPLIHATDSLRVALRSRRRGSDGSTWVSMCGQPLSLEDHVVDGAVMVDLRNGERMYIRSNCRACRAELAVLLREFARRTLKARLLRAEKRIRSARKSDAEVGQ